jgi:hypothetical protein
MNWRERQEDLLNMMNIPEGDDRQKIRGLMESLSEKREKSIDDFRENEQTYIALGRLVSKYL